MSSAKDVKVVADFDNCELSLDKIQAMRPDVVLMDISFRDENGEAAGCNGIEATRIISENAPSIRTIILTSLEEDNDAIFLSIRAGARGYLKKGADLNEVLLAIRSVAHGGTYFGSGTARRIKDFFANRSSTTSPRPFNELRRP
ncbi:MAG TPA: response regulator transcription factor, partial [Thermoflexales bacterium]|nr:response regulator transcription factor [Thermoflexales bacterium]